MFHHFHNCDQHIPCQGSWDAEKLDFLIEKLNKSYHLLGAQEYMEKACNGTLNPGMICLTFDDGLKCQYDVALPVLEKHNITGFWFIYTLPLATDGRADRMELYHHFRFSRFQTIEEFYKAFFHFLKTTKYLKQFNVQKEIDEFDISKYRPDCTFYTYEDRLFRYIRSYILKEAYHDVMFEMMNEYCYDIADAAKKLWMNAEELRKLEKAGHVIGLHSHTHHTNLTSLSYEEQLNEWVQNKNILESILNQSPQAASYPCGNYNADTIKIMKMLGIKVGFADNILKTNLNGTFSINRIDNTELKEFIGRKE